MQGLDGLECIDAQATLFDSFSPPVVAASLFAVHTTSPLFANSMGRLSNSSIAFRSK